jgi:hypothetical protein
MIRRTRSILMIGADQDAVGSLAEALRSHGHTVLIARDTDHALSILEFRALEVLIADFQTLNGDGEMLISCAGCVVPRPRVVVLGGAGPADNEWLLSEPAGSLFLPKPVDLRKLLAFLEPSPARSSFSGFVEGVDLLEYLQFLILSGKKTVLAVTSSLGTQGMIFLADGIILHSACGILDGEQALYSCLCFREGTFSHRPWEDPGQVTINKPGEFLLMEAVGKRDEAWSYGSEEDSD